MLRYVFAFLVALTLAGCSPQQEQPVAPDFPTVHFELDDSDSNLIASDPEFALVVAKAAAEYVAALTPGTKVSMRTFGEVNGANNLRFETQITRKSNPAEKVAREVAQAIVAHAKGDNAKQSRTEIFFTLGEGRYDCATGDTVILLSDGIPSGQVRSPRALLEGEEALPKLVEGSLSGCSVMVWGFGRTADGAITSTQIGNLRSAYEVAMDHAGAQFEAVSNP